VIPGTQYSGNVKTMEIIKESMGAKGPRHGKDKSVEQK
jgi:hypothetical protein